MDDDRFERLIVVGQAPEDHHAGPSMRDHNGWALHRAAERHAGAWLDATWVESEDRGFIATLERTLNGQLTRPVTESDSWHVFVRAARRTAEEILRTVDDRRTWVYLRGAGMLLVPVLLREERPDLLVTLRLPSPWPAPDLFARLPWRAELLHGATGADVVSLPSERDRKNLARSFGRYLGGVGVAARSGTILLGDGRRVRTFANAPGIHVAETLALARHESVDRELERWRQQLGGRSLVLAVDRLHASGGLLEQLTAVERLLGDRPPLRDRTAFVVVATEAAAGTERTRRDIESTIGRINGRFTRPGGSVPVHYLHGGAPAHVLAALYRLSRVLVATPLLAGASLAVKEYTTIQQALSGDGRVLLSETSGTSTELPQALRCNPYDLDGIAAGVADALEMDDDVARRALAAMATRIARHDVHAWWQREREIANDPRAEHTASIGA